ncbi:MAG: putative quinol monooxygenase [bacterium]|nr:putative quinol monooxygenase [bacterium]
MSEVLTAVARVRAVPGSEAVVRDALAAMVAPTLEEAGCIAYRLHVVGDDPGLFYFVALWRSEADLDAHLAEPHIADGLAAVESHIRSIDIKRMTRIA